jgi:hypothetical protein
MQLSISKIAEFREDVKRSGQVLMPERITDVDCFHWPRALTSGY